MGTTKVINELAGYANDKIVGGALGVNKVHLVIDFNYNYHLFKYKIESEILKPLSITTDDGEVIDTTYLYHVIANIESYRKNVANIFPNAEVVVSICADSRSVRKDEDSDYKSNREGKLQSSDIDNIDLILETLKIAGYNMYKEEEKEADDLINSLASKYKSEFDMTVIYTNDSDLTINLDDSVVLMRYKSSIKRYELIHLGNMSELFSTEYKCNIVNNNIILYKSLVGDKSDKIKGVAGFGVKAFDKYMNWLVSCGIEPKTFESFKEPEKVLKVLQLSKPYLGESKLAEAIESFNLVKPRECNSTSTIPVKMDSHELRSKAYSKYKMFSLLVV